MRLNSPAFSNGTAIPPVYTCDGQDISPPLDWREVPKGTHSFALLCDDPDAPGGTWHHWAAYDIPANLTALPQGAAQEADRLGFKQGENDFQRSNYGGPCPPHRHGRHRYHFRLLALAVEHLAVGKKASCREIEHNARTHVLGEAVLVGTYER